MQQLAAGAKPAELRANLLKLCTADPHDSHLREFVDQMDDDMIVLAEQLVTKWDKRR